MTLITEQILKEYGFKLIMSDYWRRGDFALMRTYEDNKALFIIGGVNKYPMINQLEDLKRIYKEKTGEELTKLNH